MSSIDLRYGYLNEQNTIQMLRDFFKMDLQKTSGEYHPYDFVCGDTYFELKTRRCRKNTYPTTMVGFNKIKEAQNSPMNEYYFVFKFNDGVYYWKFDPTKTYNPCVGGRCDRGKPEYKDYYYLPIEELTEIIL